jgi:hypothetical protein
MVPLSVGGTGMSGVALPMRLLPSYFCLCEECERSILQRYPMQRFLHAPCKCLTLTHWRAQSCHVTPVTCYLAVA